jgi:hypothetical protein
MNVKLRTRQEEQITISRGPDMSQTTQDAKLKKAIKDAFRESLEENKDFFQEIITEALEDVGLLRAMMIGRKTKLVPREKVMAILKGKK